MTDKDFDAFTQNEVVDATADYATRGRKHRDMPDNDLSAAWVISFKNVARDFTNPQLWSIQNDLSAEYALRAETPPYGLVAEDRTRLVAAILTMAKEIGVDDELGASVLRQFASFLAGRDGKRN
jgi:hypothetical protein